MLSLIKSERFQEEYNGFKNRAASISDENYKKDVEKFIEKLYHQVKQLDTQHEQMVFTQQMDTMSTDVKTKIMELRKTIERRLTDWERRTTA